MQQQGFVDDLLQLSQRCAAASGNICRGVDASSPGVESALATLRAAAANLIETIDTAACTSPLLRLPREVLIRILRECPPRTLAQLDCCAKALHAADPRTARSLVDEAVSAAAAQFPVEVMVPRRSKVSSPHGLERLRCFKGTGRSWLGGIAYHDAQVLLPDFAPAALELSAALEAVVYEALHSDAPAYWRDGEKLDGLSRREVQKRAVDLLAEIYSPPGNQLGLCGLVTPPVGDLAAQLVSQAMLPIDVPAAVDDSFEAVAAATTAAMAARAHRARAYLLAVEMAKVLDGSIDLKTAWSFTHTTSRWRDGGANPSLQRELENVDANERSEFLLREAAEARRGALLRAAWQYRSEISGAHDETALLLGGHAAWALTESKQCAAAEEVLRQQVADHSLPLAHSTAKEKRACQVLLLEVLTFTKQWEASSKLLVELIESPPPADDGSHCVYDWHREMSSAARATVIGLDEANLVEELEVLLRARIEHKFGDDGARHRAAVESNPSYLLCPQRAVSAITDRLPLQLRNLLIKLGRVDKTEALLEAIQYEEEQEAAEATRPAEGLPNFVLRRDNSEPPGSTVLQMQLAQHLAESGQDEAAVSARDKLAAMAVDAISRAHERTLACSRKGDFDDTHSWFDPPYGAMRGRNDEAVQLPPMGSPTTARRDHQEFRRFGRRFWVYVLEILGEGAVHELDEKVEVLLQERVRQSRELHGDDDERTWGLIGCLMTVLDEHRKPSEALPLAREFVRWTERNLGARHRTTLQATEYLSKVAATAGAEEEAIELRMKVYSELRRISSEDQECESLGVVAHDCGKRLSDFLERLGKHGESATVLGAMLRAMEDAPPPDHSYMYPAHLVKFDLAKALENSDQKDKAVGILRPLVVELAAKCEEEEPSSRWSTSWSRNHARSGALMLHSAVCYALGRNLRETDAPYSEAAEVFRAGLVSARRRNQHETELMMPQLHICCALDLARVIVVAHAADDEACGSLADAQDMLEEVVLIARNDDDAEVNKLEIAILRDLGAVLQLLNKHDEADAVFDRREPSWHSIVKPEHL